MTYLYVALEGETVAETENVCPTSRVRVSGVTSTLDTYITSSSTYSTVTSHDAVFPPSFVVTVMVVVPSFRAVTSPLELTEAMEESSEAQVMLLSLAFEGRTVALRVALSPTFSLRLVLDISTLSTEIILALTVTEQVACLPPQEAVIVAFPARCAVTTPLLSTVATYWLDVLQVTFLSEASEGRTVALRVAVSSSVRVSVFWERVTEETGIVLFVTVTAQVAVLFPSLVVTVIVAVPSLTAVTSPSALTVATDSSDEDQLTTLSVALSGLTVAVRVVFPPSTRERVVFESSTPVTETVASVTVIVQVARLSPEVAVMTEEPAFLAVTRPLLTDATLLLDEDQVTVLSVALAGRTVAVICMVLPVTISALAISSSTLVTLISGSTGSSPFLTTVTGQEANLPPAAAVIAVVPSARAVIVPSAATFATEGLDEVHSTVLSVAFSGRTVAVRVSVSPISNSTDSLSRETDSTGTSLEEVTVTWQVVDTNHAVAVIVVVPSFSAVMKPSFTVATLGSEDSQVTSGKVALAGSTVAVSDSISPTSIVTEVLSRVTESTSISGGRQEWNRSPKLNNATIIVRNFFICSKDLPLKDKQYFRQSQN